MWPAESEFGREHVEYKDLNVGDLVIGIENRLLSPIVVYRIDTLTTPSSGHLIVTEFCWTTSSFPIHIGQYRYVEKSDLGENLHRILRVQDIKLKKLLKSFAFARTFDPNQLKELLVELEI